MIPALQAGWLAELLGVPLPDEPHATCESCAMLPPPGERFTPGGAYFNPATKCCTFTPTLANFLVGRLLLDPDPALREGRERVRARIQARAAVTPMGVRPSWVHYALYQPASPRFGRSSVLLCPYYLEGGACGIWSHRNGVCSTWFCKHARGAVGLRFWKAIERLLLVTERAVARWCVLRLDVGPEALQSLFPDGDVREPSAPPGDDHGDADPATHARRWGRWAGREEAFYAAAAGLVAPLGWADIERLGGSEVALAAALARHARDAASLGADAPALPAAVSLGTLSLTPTSDGLVRVTTHSPLDPLDLPRELVDLLPRLTGRPLGEARAALAAESGLELDDALLARLIDFEALRPSG